MAQTTIEVSAEPTINGHSSTSLCRIARVNGTPIAPQTNRRRASVRAAPSPATPNNASKLRGYGVAA